jgi:hypothetical protein
MVVQSIALPKVAGGVREQEISVVPADAAAVPAGSIRDAHSGSLSSVIVPLLVATQAAWLAVLGYGVFRFLI